MWWRVVLFLLLTCGVALGFSHAPRRPIVSPAGGGYSASYVSSSYGTGTTTTVVVSAPSGIQDGDMILAFATSEVGANPPTCTGFTQVGASSVSLHSGYSFYRVAASESGDYTWTFPTTSSGLIVHLVVIEKDGGTWVTPTTTGYWSSTTPTTTDADTTPAVTTQDGSVLVCGFGNDDSVNQVSSAPSGMTAAVSRHTVGTMCAATYYEEVATGASGVTKTLTWSTSGDYVSGNAVVVYAQ